MIGTKSFEEQYILGALIGDRLEHAGFDTSRRDGLGSTVIFHALVAGDVDVYVDYSGTLWTDEMKRTRYAGARGGAGPDDGMAGASTAYACWARSASRTPMPSRCARDRAEALAIDTLADLAAHAPRHEDRRRLRNLQPAGMARGREGLWRALRAQRQYQCELHVSRGRRAAMSMSSRRSPATAASRNTS